MKILLGKKIKGKKIKGRNDQGEENNQGEEMIKKAFDLIVTEATKVEEGCYLCLMEERPYYGGPEEGGWWGSDSFVVCYKYFLTEELALKAKEEVSKLANELSEAAKISFGKQCLYEMDLIETRGLDFPEPDGESKYFVYLGTELPQNSLGKRVYS